MKPDWDSAPEWAEYMAIDEDGSWWWFEKEPEWKEMFGMWGSRGECKAAFDPKSIVAKDTLEKRPAKQ